LKVGQSLSNILPFLMLGSPRKVRVLGRKKMPRNGWTSVEKLAIGKLVSLILLGSDELAPWSVVACPGNPDVIAIVVGFLTSVLKT